jgi:O-acetyl-ADP-ribose deacetylase (regulator of RNase III)
METAGNWTLQRGQIFHGLLVHSALGEGAMGAAYLASHPILQIPLVIKTFKTTADSNIFKEAHLAARVHSANVVGVLDAGVESGIAFVVQRYVDGIDLSELVGRLQETGWQLPINVVCRILIDAARGLHCIHQAGIVHRDVKPANLFLCGNGDTTVGDFGIALDAVHDGSGELIVGTPTFMAPEQWAKKTVDRRTDIYALGATAHLLATGRPLFGARNIGEWLMAHLHQAYVPPAASEPDAAYLFSVIERMLRKQAEERYPTAEALARVLDVIAEPVPPLVCTTPNAARIGPLHVTLEVGDIAASAGDVIVNAANVVLAMDVGVARALRLAGGQAIEEEAMAHGPVAMGDVVWTAPGKLRARWVAHAVAALNGAICLQRCALRTLLGAEARQAQSIVFPALGTGVGDVPIYLAAKLMFEAMQTFASLQPRYARQIRVMLHDDVALARWRTVMQSMSPEIESEPSFTHADQVPTISSPRDDQSQITVVSRDEQPQAIISSGDEQTQTIISSRDEQTQTPDAPPHDQQTIITPALPDDQYQTPLPVSLDDQYETTVSRFKAQPQPTTAMLHEQRQTNTAMLKEQHQTVTAPLDKSTLGADVVLPDTTAPFPPPVLPIVKICPTCESEYSAAQRFCVRDGTPLPGEPWEEEY